jgi:2-oxoglutarate ferredoxin oxidoreductase subunit beta
VTWNKHNTYDWFKERVYDLQKAKYKPNDIEKAFAKALEGWDKIPIGVFFKEERENYEDTHPVLKGKPLVKQRMDNVSVNELMEELCR